MVNYGKWNLIQIISNAMQCNVKLKLHCHNSDKTQELKIQTCSTGGSERYFLLNSSCWSLVSLCHGVGSVKGGRPSCWYSNSWDKASLCFGLRFSFPSWSRPIVGTSWRRYRLVSADNLSVDSYLIVGNAFVDGVVLTVVVAIVVVVEVVVVVVEVVDDDG